LDTPIFENDLQEEYSSTEQAGDPWLPRDVSFSLEDSIAFDQLLESLAEPLSEPCTSCATGCGCSSDAATAVTPSDSLSGPAPLLCGESSGWCHPALCEPETHLDGPPHEAIPGPSQRQQQADRHSDSLSGESRWPPLQSASPTQSGHSTASVTRTPGLAPSTATHRCHSPPDRTQRLRHGSNCRKEACHSHAAPEDHSNCEQPGCAVKYSSSCGSPPCSSDDEAAQCGTTSRNSTVFSKTPVSPARDQGGEGVIYSLLPPGTALEPLHKRSQDLLSNLMQQALPQEQQLKQQQETETPKQRRQKPDCCLTPAANPSVSIASSEVSCPIPEVCTSSACAQHLPAADPQRAPLADGSQANGLGEQSEDVSCNLNQGLSDRCTFRDCLGKNSHRLCCIVIQYPFGTG
jgi:hypothetical protein